LNGIYNAILICKPKNKILYKCIKKCIENIENKKYFSKDLCQSGPLMMKKFFLNKEINNLELTHDLINKYIRFINLNNYRILKYNKDYYKEEIKRNNHWSKYYKTRTMYK